MNIGAIGGGGELIQSQLRIRGQNGSDPMEEFADKLTQKIMEMKDADGDGFLSNQEFKIPEQKFLKADTDGNGLLSQDELKGGMMKKLEQLKSLMSGSEGIMAEIQEKIKKMSEEEEEEFLVEIPFNGIDDDKDGEIDEDDFSAFSESSEEEGSIIDSASSQSSNPFDILI